MGRRLLPEMLPKATVRMLASAVALIALLAVAASSQASTKFGAKLRTTDGSVVQPNANQSCLRSSPGLGGQRCTRVAVRYTLAGAAEGNIRAPRDGVIKQIKFVARGNGNFNFELARVRHYQGGDYGRAKVVARTGNIHYEASPSDPQAIQTAPVHEKVEKGDYLAVESSHWGMLGCGPDRSQQLLFQPVLQLGGQFRSNKGHNSDCTVLTQAVYRPTS